MIGSAFAGHSRGTDQSGPSQASLSLRAIPFVAGLFVTTALATPGLSQEYPETSFRITMTVSEEEPLGVGVRHFIDRLAEETGGNVAVDFFPSGQLGQDLEVFEQLSNNTVQMHASGFGINANYNSFYAPWLLTGFDHVQRVLQSDLAQQWNDELVEERGVIVLTAYPRAPRHISSNGHPIEGPDDLDGLRMRVPEIPVMFNVFREVGTDAVAMSFAEVYTALQTGTIEAQENPLPTIVGFSLQEVQEYVSLTYHSYAPEYIYVNAEWWGGLPENLQDLMVDLLEEGRERAAEATASVQEELIAELEASGTEVVEADIDALREAAMPALEELGPEYLGEETYSTIVDLSD
ncbi:MAG: TRAP transporter substrate-binding protein [Azospirillaceae bacterium]